MYVPSCQLILQNSPRMLHAIVCSYLYLSIDRDHLIFQLKFSDSIILARNLLERVAVFAVIRSSCREQGQRTGHRAKVMMQSVSGFRLTTRICTASIKTLVSHCDRAGACTQLMYNSAALMNNVLFLCQIVFKSFLLRPIFLCRC